MISRAILLICVLSMFAGVGSSQMEGNPDNWCRGGFFTRESKDFGLGIVKAKRGTRAYFYKDDLEKCPDDAACRTATYIVPGDKVVKNRKRGNYVCAWYTPAKGSPTVGWLRSSDLDFPLLLSDASEESWVGEWQYALNEITITQDKLKGFLNVSGTAFWKGLGDNIHIGEIDGRFEHKDGVLEYSDGDDEFDCKATLRLLPGYLIVADNLKCGGANVTFSGVYKRTVKPTGKRR